MLEFVTAFTNDRDRIDVTANPITNRRQLRQGFVPIKLNGTQLGGKQLGGKSVGLNPAPPSLALETRVGLGGQMNSAISRCHNTKFKARFR